MARKPTVLTPKAAKPERTTTVEPREVRGWRARPRELDPFGMRVPPFVGDEDEVRAWADENADLRPIIEVLVHGAYAPEPRHIETVVDLAANGMAHRTEDGKAWRITSMGYDVLDDAMRGER